MTNTVENTKDQTPAPESTKSKNQTPAAAGSTRTKLSKVVHRIYGTPSRTQILRFRDHIWKRYTLLDVGVNPQRPEDIQNADRAILYLERVIDRMINKARGILPFNTIVITLVSIELSRANQSTLVHIFDGLSLSLFSVCEISLFLLTISSIILMTLFWVNFGEVDHVETFSKEAEETVYIIRRRAIRLQIAVFLSFAGIFFAVIVAIVGF
jgi:hypothetical protein